MTTSNVNLSISNPKLELEYLALVESTYKKYIVVTINIHFFLLSITCECFFKVQKGRKNKGKQSNEREKKNPKKKPRMKERKRRDRRSPQN
jgi:type III secretory pathway component EscU